LIIDITSLSSWRWPELSVAIAQTERRDLDSNHSRCGASSSAITTGRRSPIYCEEEPGWRTAAHLLTRDEARRVAANAKLADLLAAKGRRTSTENRALRR
jgi:hypothetical protein